MYQNLKAIFRRKFRKLLQILTFAKQNIVNFDQTTIDSEYLNRVVGLKIYSNSRSESNKVKLLLINDGQDLEQMNFRNMLAELFLNNSISNVLVVGIDAGNRMQEFGTSRMLDYKKRGSKAPAYTKFVCLELIPFIQSVFSHLKFEEKAAIAGFSLGGLSAFDIAWHNQQLFKAVGVFSGSLWWRSKKYIKTQPDANRIAHSIVEKTIETPLLKCWFQAGTKDETADRNNNGVIDAIDDTLDLLQLLERKGLQQPNDLFYHEVQNGTHEPKTWGKAMPHFLKWAFKNKD